MVWTVESAVTAVMLMDVITPLDTAAAWLDGLVRLTSMCSHRLKINNHIFSTCQKSPITYCSSVVVSTKYKRLWCTCSLYYHCYIQ